MTAVFRCRHQEVPAYAARERSCPDCRREAKIAGKRGSALDGLMERIDVVDPQQEEGTEMTAVTTKKATARKPASKRTAAKPAAKKATSKRVVKTVEHGARTRRKARLTGSTVAVYNTADDVAKPVDHNGKRITTSAPDGKPWLAVCETHGSTKWYPTWTEAGASAEPDTFCRKCAALVEQ